MSVANRTHLSIISEVSWHVSGPSHISLNWDLQDFGHFRLAEAVPEFWLTGETVRRRHSAVAP